jgi:large subunit ribosomal protein L31
MIKAYICTLITKSEGIMKKDIHPDNYRLVVFKDFSCDFAFITRSAAQTKDTITWEDGNEYPLVKLEISNMSHPFFTGKMKFVDTAGRIEKFNRKYQRKK